MSCDRVTSWNCKVGRNPSSVCDSIENLIENTNPDVICLQEAKQYTDALHNRFDSDWYVYAKKGWEESTANPVLVHRSQGNRKGYGEGWGTLRYKTRWVGPQGGAHDGRTWTWALVNGLYVMSLHRCTDGDGRNSDAFADEARILEDWIDDCDSSVLVIGDHNCGHKATYYGASKTIAQAVDGMIVADAEEPGIDYAIKRGLKGDVHRGKSYGSDHECVKFVRAS